MLNVYLLRHGQTAWNADNNRYCGRTDLALTDLGIKQAEYVHGQLRSISFEAVYSSPLQRAVQTAKIVSGTDQIILDDRLIEADFGAWEGKTREEFVKENPSLWQKWELDPTSCCAGETGETAEAIIRRVDDFFTIIQHRHTQGNILVVAHNAVNRFYLSHKLGMEAKNYRQLFFDNSAVSMFQLDKQGQLTLNLLNSRGVLK